MPSATDRPISALALVPLSLAVAAGCSFLIDFPAEGGTTATGTGGAGGSSTTGGGGQGGSGVPSCFGGGVGATSDELTWIGISKSITENRTVATSGLSYLSGQQKLMIMGTSREGLQMFNLLTGPANQIYVVGRYDNGTVELALTGHACTWPWQNREPMVRRIVTEEDSGFSFIAGSLPTDEDCAGTWSFADDETEGCGTSTETQYATIPGVKAGPVPLVIDQHESFKPTTMLSLSEGAMLDVALTEYASPRVWLGAARGNLDGTMVTDTSVFFLFKKYSDDHTLVVPDLYPNTRRPMRSLPGAITFDENEVAWFGGSSCEAPGGCDDEQLYFGRVKNEDAAATVLDRRLGVTSSITSVRHFDGRIMVGGEYEGELAFRGATLPEAATSVPFVALIDPTTEQALWTWPAAGASSGADPDVFRSVVDVAAGGTKDCGAVYVLGCVGPSTIGYRDCATIEPGKTTFLTKLDIVTGTEIWSSTVPLATPLDIFMPTAITAADERVWVAATYIGTVDVWGQHLESGKSRESAVLRLAP